MKYFGWLIVTLFIALVASGQVLAADDSRIAFNDYGWGNTDFGNTSWVNTSWGNTNFRNSDWKNTGWGNTEMGNTGWENRVQNPENENMYEKLMKVTLGIKKPSSFCAMVVTWAKSSQDAINAAAKDCKDCIIDELGTSDTPGADAETLGKFCQ